MRLDPDTKAEADRLAKEIAKVARRGLAAPGSLTHRLTICGRAGCRCGGEPPRPHGPYWSWTRKIGNKTVTRYLSDDQHEDYGAFFENARRLRELVAHLEALGLQVIESDPRWRR
ncbi:MAG: DUF6788 family protein [Acidimicrobiales bacterium]